MYAVVFFGVATVGPAVTLSLLVGEVPLCAAVDISSDSIVSMLLTNSLRLSKALSVSFSFAD